MKSWQSGVVVLAVSVGLGLFFYDGESFRLTTGGTKKGLLDIFSSSHSKNFDKAIDQYNQAFDDKKAKDQAMVDDYYTIATDFYEYGWSDSFHFAHHRKGETFERSLRRHEERLSDELGLKKGFKVLDAGSGVGGPARTVAQFSGAHVTGITINSYQVARSVNLTKKAGLENQVNFKVMDFLKMEFADNTFDAVYAIESTCHAPELKDVYKEIFRVLKPGGKFVAYEWVLTDKYNEKNPAHVLIKKDIEYGNGLPPLRSTSDPIPTAKAVGFEVLKTFDLVQEDKGNTIPWYNRLDMGFFSYYMTHITCWVSETFGFAPKGTIATHAMLMHAVSGLVDGGREEIFTPMFMVVSQKPVGSSA